MPDFHDLVKHIVEFGVPLNETSPLGGALNVLLIRGSEFFNRASEVNQDPMVFLVSDLVACGADLTHRISETTIVPSHPSWEPAEGGFARVHCSGSYLYAVTRKNIHDGMSIFSCKISFLCSTRGEPAGRED